MTPSVRVSLQASSAGFFFGMFSLTGCGAASDAVRGMSGAGTMSALPAGNGGDSGATSMSGSSAGGSSAGGSSAGGSSAGGSSAGGSSAGGSGAGRSGAGGSSAGGSGGSAPDPNGGAPSGPSSSRHVARPVGSVTGTTSGFWEYLPPHYGNGARYPLLVFWHGIGENGDGSLAELQKVPANGPPRLVKEDRWPAERTFIVLSPQHPGTGCPSSQEIDAFIQFAIAHYDVDLTRVYLTGLSCGAIGSWNYLGDHQGKVVAAAVLVCGDGRNAFTKAGCALGRVPIWALHGELDPTVPPLGSTEPLAKLNACSPPPVDAKLTIYPGVTHDSWTRTFDLSAGNDVYSWLMSHVKP